MIQCIISSIKKPVSWQFLKQFGYTLTLTFALTMAPFTATADEEKPNCQQSFVNEKKLSKDDWKAVYDDAEQEDNYATGTYAFYQLIWHHRKELGLSLVGRRALKLHLKHFDFLFRNRNYDPDLSPRRGKDYLGQDIKDFPQLRKKQLHSRLKNGLKHLVWSWLPFFYRYGWYRIDNAIIKRLSTQLENKILTPEGLKILGISESPFFEKLKEEYIQTDENHFKYTHKRRNFAIFVLPLLLSVTNNALGGIINPFTAFDFVRNGTEENIWLGDAIEVLEQKAKNRSALGEIKKVTLLYNPELLTQTQDLTNFNLDLDMSEFKSFNVFKTPEIEFNSFSFRNSQEFIDGLKKGIGTQPDLLMIFSHGYHGGFIIQDNKNGIAFLDQILPHISKNQRLPDHSVLGLLCCSTGNEYELPTNQKQEQLPAEWIQLSEKTLGKNGHSIAFLNNLMFHPLNIPSTQAEEPIKTIFTSLMLEATVIIDFWYERGLTLNKQKDAIESLFYKPLKYRFPKDREGYRIYDAETGETEAFEIKD